MTRLTPAAQFMCAKYRSYICSEIYTSDLLKSLGKLFVKFTIANFRPSEPNCYYFQKVHMLVILSGCVGRRIHLSKMTPRTLFSLKLTNSPSHDYKISTSPSPTLPQQHVLELLMENFNIAESSQCTGRVPSRKTFEKKL